MHILILASDAAAGAGLQDQIALWAEAGHRVTVVACRAAPELPGARIEVLRVGGPRSVFPRAAWATARGLGAEADVILEVVGPGAFLTPLWLWLSKPRAVLIADGWNGRAGSVLYKGTPQLISPAAAHESLAAIAERNLDVLAAAARRGPRRLRDSDAAKAGGLAAATLINNAIQLAFTIVFTRLLGLNNYGSLAALVSAFLILLVGGQAIQVAAAREVARGRLGGLAEMGRSVRSWTRSLIAATAVAALAGVLLRVPLASLIGVPEHPWGAAALPATGTLWLLLSLQRGVLQGLHAYKSVGLSIICEGSARLFGALILVAAGAGVTGAFLATPLSLIAIALGITPVLRARLGYGEPAGTGVLPAAAVSTLRGLVAGGWGPIFGLTLLALLQNVDVIVVRHQLHGNRAGSYAAAAVAAKAVVWVAIGVGLYLLPEATRRAQAGLDPRPVLMRALAVLALIAAPALLIFAAVPHLLLSVAFGEKATQASSALLLLGAAMTLLAVSYLTVQYMLALGTTSFLWPLAVAALIEPFLLSAGSFSLFTYASIVLGLQVASAGVVLVLGLRARLVRGGVVAESMA